MFTRIFLLLLMSVTLLMARSEREGHWQLTLNPTYTASKTLNYANNDKVEINDRTGWGFGIGYNFNAHFNVDLNFNSSSGSYVVNYRDVNNTQQHLKGNLYSSSTDIRLTYNIMDDDFTPFIALNIGSTFVDSGIATGDYYYGCYPGYYYYPWCGTFAETHTTTSFRYGGSAGVRYDLKNELFFKGAVNVNMLDFNSDNSPYFISYDVTIGMMFK